MQNFKFPQEIIGRAEALANGNMEGWKWHRKNHSSCGGIFISKCGQWVAKESYTVCSDIPECAIPTHKFNEGWLLQPKADLSKFNHLKACGEIKRMLSSYKGGDYARPSNCAYFQGRAVVIDW